MKKSKIALKPYLDKLAGYCSTLSKEELTDIIIRLARDAPTSGRVDFLERIESYLPGHRSVKTSDIDPVEQILDEIEALRESIEERLRSIEDGSYWDDPDVWGDDGYYEEEPDPLSKDQSEELGGFFEDAKGLFLDDRLEDARKVYRALFHLIGAIEDETYYSPPFEMDIREERARYCRCIYETSNADKRLDEFVEAMEIDVSDPYDENEYDEDYPLIQDVIDAKPGGMGDLASFLPDWKSALIKKGTKGRPGVLLLEAVSSLEGVGGVARLARKWKDTQPQGYLFWLNILKRADDQKGIIHVGTEALKALTEGRFRENVAEFMIDAAGQLDDAKHLLIGKRERFFSYRSDQNLLDLVAEATKQNVRAKEIDKVIQNFRDRKSTDEERALYTKALLMSGRLGDAVATAKNEKSVGWSYGSSAGLVFGSVLSVLADHSEKASTIRTLLKGYANKISAYSGRFSSDDIEISFYDEIVKGLKQEKDTKSQATESLSWAEKIGKKRIDHIVSNKHRRAYERAAQVLGSLAEAYAAMDQEDKASRILHQYYMEKYNRFSAFRGEVKAVFMNSELLRNLPMAL